MTKIKNTKKGMAKKTLSMSLVVAMLATSNVPVWAAEFSDGTDVAVTSEAPATDDTTADVAEEAFTDESDPEITTEETVAPATAVETNTDGYISTMKVNLNAKGWGNEVTVSGTLTDKNGANVVTTDNEDANKKVQVSYVWLSDGREANNHSVAAQPSSAVLATSATVNTIKYTPNRDDFNKDLSLMVTVKRGNTVIYQETVAGGTVGAQDISNSFTAALTGIADKAYNGKEQKVVPTNKYTVPTEFKDANGNTVNITEKHISWNYSVKGNDFKNVTENDITVIGTLEGTYDATSDAYGYKATTASGTYQITPLTITSKNLVASMKTTSVQYTGQKQKFGKSDVTLQVKTDGGNIDISDTIDKDKEFTSTAVNVNDGYTLTVDTIMVS